MAGGSIGFKKSQGWGERASARRSATLSIAQSETGTLPGSQDQVSPNVVYIAWHRWWATE